MCPLNFTGLPLPLLLKSIKFIIGLSRPWSSHQTKCKNEKAQQVTWLDKHSEHIS